MAYKIIYHILGFISSSSMHKSHHAGIYSFKKIWKKHSFTVGYPLLNKCAAHFLAHFGAIIAKLKMSNLIRMVKCSRGRGGGVLLYESDEGACQKILITALTGTRILFYGRVPNSFSPLRGTNSTTTNYMKVLRQLWQQTF